MKYTFLDEILLLSEQLIDIAKNEPVLPKVKEEHEIAKSLISRGKRAEFAKHALKADSILYFRNLEANKDSRIESSC